MTRKEIPTANTQVGILWMASSHRPKVVVFVMREMLCAFSALILDHVIPPDGGGTPPSPAPSFFPLGFEALGKRLARTNGKVAHPS